MRTKSEKRVAYTARTMAVVRVLAKGTKLLESLKAVPANCLVVNRHGS